MLCRTFLHAPTEMYDTRLLVCTYGYLSIDVFISIPSRCGVRHQASGKVAGAVENTQGQLVHASGNAGGTSLLLLVARAAVSLIAGTVEFRIARSLPRIERYAVNR